MSDLILNASEMVRAGQSGVLVDADTGQRIRWAMWANLTTGEYEALRMHPAEIRRRGLKAVDCAYKGRAHLRYVAFAPRVVGLSKPHTASEIAEMVRHARKGLPCLIVEGVECDEPKCHRLAEWQTVEEQEIEPAIGAPFGVAQPLERAVAVKVWRWCPWHYRFPTFKSLRGVESETQVKARPS